jgi:hypothetical protein
MSVNSAAWGVTVVMSVARGTTEVVDNITAEGQLVWFPGVVVRSSTSVPGAVKPPGWAVCESASRPCYGFWCLNDKMIKELMSFAKCEIGNMSCDYVEAIHSSRHTLWPIWLHILNVIKKRRISSNEKEENDLMMYDTCLLLSQNIFKTWGHILLHQHFKDY